MTHNEFRSDVHLLCLGMQVFYNKLQSEAHSQAESGMKWSY